VARLRLSSSNCPYLDGLSSGVRRVKLKHRRADTVIEAGKDDRNRTAWRNPGMIYRIVWIKHEIRLPEVSMCIYAGYRYGTIACVRRVANSKRTLHPPTHDCDRICATSRTRRLEARSVIHDFLQRRTVISNNFLTGFRRKVKNLPGSWAGERSSVDGGLGRPGGDLDTLAMLRMRCGQYRKSYRRLVGKRIGNLPARAGLVFRPMPAHISDIVKGEPSFQLFARMNLDSASARRLPSAAKRGRAWPPEIAGKLNKEASDGRH